MHVLETTELGLGRKKGRRKFVKIHVVEVYFPLFFLIFIYFLLRQH